MPIEQLNDTASLLPRLFYVEDDPEWRREVLGYIRDYSRVNFEEVLQASSLDEFVSSLIRVDGPSVLLMDLRLGGDSGASANYDGYNWILDELRNFLENHPATLVFVLSGQLDAGIRATLIDRGVPEHHLFGKDKWDSSRAQMMHLLREELTNLDSYIFEQISRGFAAKKVDPEVSQTLLFLDPEETVSVRLHLREDGQDDDPWAPAGDTSVEHLLIEGAEARCSLSRTDLASLVRDPKVLRITADRPLKSRLSVCPLKSGQIENFSWKISSGIESYVIELRFDSSDHYVFQLITPEYDNSPHVQRAGKRIADEFPDGTRYAMAYVLLDAETSQSRLVVTIAHGKNAKSVPAGQWEIEIQALKVEGGAVTVWS